MLTAARLSASNLMASASMLASNRSKKAAAAANGKEVLIFVRWRECKDTSETECCRFTPQLSWEQAKWFELK